MTVQRARKIDSLARMLQDRKFGTCGLRNQTVRLLVGTWIFSMIALPIARWVGGDSVIPFMATMSVVFQCAAVVVVLQESWGLRRTVTVFTMVAVLTWSVEWLGSTTGFPFSAYHYTSLLQPQLFGVPLLIPLAWLMMLGPSWAASYAILGNQVDTLPRRLAFAAITGLAMAAWDLYLDPQMTVWGFWVWDGPGAYFGIPLVNFAGWFAVAGLVTFIVRPSPVLLAPLIIIYGVVWVFQAIGLAFFWGQPGPALFGFLAMGAILAASWYRAGWSLWTR